jgi:hypothetical protein
VPTTAAGLIALLKYAVFADIDDGETWPRHLTLLCDDGQEVSASWHQHLIQNVAEILPNIVRAA